MTKDNIIISDVLSYREWDIVNNKLKKYKFPCIEDFRKFTLEEVVFIVRAIHREEVWEVKEIESALIKMDRVINERKGRKGK